MPFISEADIEAALMQQLAVLGYACQSDTLSCPDGERPERETYADTILTGRLRAAIETLNPTIPLEAREDALKKIIASEKPSLVEENRRLHRAMCEGVKVEF